jgi:REP element-mobilizing transposase RayT
MPNHIHGILMLVDVVGASRGGSSLRGQSVSLESAEVSKESLLTSQTRPYAATAKRRPLCEIVRAFKSFSARRINALRQTAGIPVWQRNYYERVIRNEGEMGSSWRYIEANPVMWGKDDENPYCITVKS